MTATMAVRVSRSFAKMLAETAFRFPI
jgi:hypothetical protein